MHKHERKHYRNKSIQLRDLPRILKEEILVKSLQTADKTLRQNTDLLEQGECSRRMREEIREGGIRERPVSTLKSKRVLTRESEIRATSRY